MDIPPSFKIARQVTTSASIAGGFFVLLTYIRYREIRSLASEMILWIALGSTLQGAVSFLSDASWPAESPVSTEASCAIRAFLTQLFFCAQQAYAAALALHLLSVHSSFKRPFWTSGRFWHSVCWAISMLFTLPPVLGLAAGDISYSINDSGVCFLKGIYYNITTELASLFSSIICFWVAGRVYFSQRTSSSQLLPTRNSMSLTPESLDVPLNILRHEKEYNNADEILPPKPKSSEDSMYFLKPLTIHSVLMMADLVFYALRISQDHSYFIVMISIIIANCFGAITFIFWGLSETIVSPDGFEPVLLSPSLRNHFIAFCEKQLSAENARFYLAVVETFEPAALQAEACGSRADAQYVHAVDIAKRICGQFIGDAADEQINISAYSEESVFEALARNEASPELFDDALADVNLNLGDVWARFVDAREFDSLVSEMRLDKIKHGKPLLLRMWPIVKSVINSVALFVLFVFSCLQHVCHCCTCCQGWCTKSSKSLKAKDRMRLASSRRTNSSRSSARSTGRSSFANSSASTARI